MFMGFIDRTQQSTLTNQQGWQANMGCSASGHDFGLVKLLGYSITIE